MAGLLPPLIQEIRGNASELLGTYKEVAASADEMAAKTEAAGTKMVSQNTKVGQSAAKLGSGVLVGSAAILGLSTAAAVAAQTVDAKLSVAVKNAGGNFDALKPKIDAADEAGQRLGFTNDETNAALSTLTTSLGSSKKALADLALAQDVARTKNVDLSTAALAVSKAAGGQATSLQRLGIVIPTQQLAGLTTASQKGAAIMDILKQKVGGTADAYGKTLKGQLDASGAQFQALGEQIGNVLIPVFTKALTVITGFVNFLKDNKGVAIALGVAIGTIATALAAYSIATKIAAAAQLLFNVALDANPIGIIILAIGALIAIVVLLVTHWKQVSTFFGQVWSNIVGFFKAAIAWIVNAFLNFTPEGLIIKHWSGIVAWFKQLWDSTVTIFQNAIGWIVNAFLNFTPLGLIIKNWSKIVDFFKQVWVDITTTFANAGAAINKWWTGFWSGLGSLASGIFKNTFNFVTTIINDVINAINTITSALNTAGGAIGVNIKIGKIPDLPSFDVGTSGVPGPTGAPLLAVVHGGEPILSNKMMSGQAAIPQNVVNAVNNQQNGGGKTVTQNNYITTTANPQTLLQQMGWLTRQMG